MGDLPITAYVTKCGPWRHRGQEAIATQKFGRRGNRKVWSTTFRVDVNVRGRKHIFSVNTAFPSKWYYENGPFLGAIEHGVEWNATKEESIYRTVSHDVSVDSIRALGNRGQYFGAYKSVAEPSDDTDEKDGHNL